MRVALGGCWVCWGEDWEVSLVGGGDEERILGFRGFLGRVYLVIIFVWVGEVSEEGDLMIW